MGVWLLQDVRFALRNFAREPAFALGAVLLLTAGIGATTAMFALLDALPAAIASLRRG